MHVSDSYKQTPRADQVLAAAAQLAALADEASANTLKAANAIMAASTPEELSAAIRNMHEILAAQATVWAGLEDATRHWGSREQR